MPLHLMEMVLIPLTHVDVSTSQSSSQPKPECKPEDAKIWGRVGAQIAAAPPKTGRRTAQPAHSYRPRPFTPNLPLTSLARPLPQTDYTHDRGPYTYQEFTQNG